MLLVPDSVRVLLPVTVSPPDPLRTPDRVNPLFPVLIVPPPSVTFRASVKLPPVYHNVPPFSVMVFAALPSLLSALNCRVPLVIVTPPVNVFVPERTSVPAPFSVNPPAPLITPDSVSVSPLSGWNAPPPSVIFRAELNVAVASSAPPFSVTILAAAPRLLSALTLRLPAAMVLPPV